MVKNDLDKLLGGYATGTLTEEERTTLFEAALDDQQLFNTLADEEALKGLLEDPESRERLLAQLEDNLSRANRGSSTGIFEWFSRPFNLALAGGIATAAVATLVFVNLLREAPHEGLVVIDETKVAQETVARPEKEPKPPTIDTAALPPPPPSSMAARRGPPPPKAETLMDPPQANYQATAPMAGALDSRRATTDWYELALRQPHVEGPAQQLFYAAANLRSRRQRLSEPAALRSETDEARRSTQFAREKTAPAASMPQVTGRTRLGLRLTLEQQGAEGGYSRVELSTPFSQIENLRLTAEANIDGYLYVARTADETWHWIFPPSGDPGEAMALVRRGQRVTLPLLETARSARSPGTRQLLLILSRTKIPASTQAPGQVAQDEPGTHENQGLLEKWRATSEQETLIYEKQADRAIYLVSKASTPAAPLVVHLAVAPQ